MATWSSRMVRAIGLFRTHAIEHEPDRVHYESRLGLLNAVATARRLDVNAVPRAPEPFVMQRTPDFVPTRCSVHEAGGRVGLHTRNDGDRHVRQWREPL